MSSNNPPIVVDCVVVAAVPATCDPVPYVGVTVMLRATVCINAFSSPYAAIVAAFSLALICNTAP